MAAETKVAAAVDAYVSKQNPKLKPIADALRKLIRKTVPNSREAINPWGIPVFEWNGPLCYLRVGNHHITFGFPRGASILDASGLLEGTGRNMRHVKLRELSEVRNANLKQLILQAKEINKGEPLGPAMRPKMRKSIHQLLQSYK